MENKQQITLTESQQKALDQLKDFVFKSKDRVFILKGYAGTGKTTITKKLIDELAKKERSYKLCASTGRAAKILSDISAEPATTIHSLLYTYKDFNEDLDKIVEERDKGVEHDGQLFLVFAVNTPPANAKGTVYVIDESSMIGDVAENDITQAVFGSGRLLSDLINFDINGKFIFIGDGCQLPPIVQPFSPALSEDYFARNFGFRPQSAELTEIMRQRGGNDIIEKSAEIRKAYHEAPETHFQMPGGRNVWKKLNWLGCDNIKILPDQNSLLCEYAERISGFDYDKATYITSSNSKCLKISQMLRRKLGFIADIEVNDLLLVTQNNLISGLVNGDLVKVIGVGGQLRRAGLTFVNVEVRNLSNGRAYSQYLILDILYGYKINLDQVQQKELYIDFAKRMRDKGIRQKSDAFRKAMLEDPFLNALRCVYGYALTCHKAQGGEWDEVFLEPARNIMLNPVKENYQWLYTSMTRAKKYLYLAQDFYIVR